MEEAEALADYVAVIDGGVIAIEGTIGQLKKSLKDIETAKFEKDMPTLQDVFLSVVNKTGGRS